MNKAHDHEMALFFKTISQLPREAQEIFGKVWSLVATDWVAERLWERALSTSDKVILSPNTSGDDAFAVALAEYKNADRMWRKLYCVSKYRAILDVAFNTGNLSAVDYEYFLRAGNEVYADEVEQLDDYLQSRKLVIEEVERRLYLQGELQEIEWTKCETLWRFLWELVACAERREPLRSGDFFGDRCVARSTFPNVKRRLVERVPKLEPLIEADGQGGFVLELNPVTEIGIVRRTP